MTCKAQAVPRETCQQLYLSNSAVCRKLLLSALEKQPAQSNGRRPVWHPSGPGNEPPVFSEGTDQQTDAAYETQSFIFVDGHMKQSLLGKRYRQCPEGIDAQSSRCKPAAQTPVRLRLLAQHTVHPKKLLRHSVPAFPP